MARPPTDAQVENAAKAIAYRSRQLAGVSRLYMLEPSLAGVDSRAHETISNALVESALVNARALAWFFTSDSDVNVSMFDPNWDDAVQDVAKAVISPVSRHLGHATIGDLAGEQHPGVWPVVELAVTLIDGVARFVNDLDRNSATSTPASFVPSPSAAYDELMALDPQSKSTLISNNPSVGQLTKDLQAYLGWTPPR